MDKLVKSKKAPIPQPKPEMVIERQEIATIKPPRMQRVTIKIIGTAPFVSNRFSARAKEAMRSKQAEGGSASNRKKKDPKDFDNLWQESMHVSEEGWPGIPASCLRAALISACRIVNFKMTLAKLSIFVVGDGFDKIDGTPLIRIDGKPEPLESFVRINTTQTDIACRAIFKKWSANVTIEYDADQFRPTDIVNLLLRVGIQVGLGAGRPDSRTSVGLGWGVFKLEGFK